MILRFRSATDVKIPRARNVALDLGEPEFDLVQPRGVRRREVQVHTGMLGHERAHGLRCVGREIVENEVNGTRPRLRGDDLGQKGDDLGQKGEEVRPGVSRPVWPRIKPVRVFRAA
jgi:hypothetical protein